MTVPTFSVLVELNAVRVPELIGARDSSTTLIAIPIIVGRGIGAALFIIAVIGLTIVPIGGGDGIENTVKSIRRSLYLGRTYL